MLRFVIQIRIGVHFAGLKNYWNKRRALCRFPPPSTYGILPSNWRCNLESRLSHSPYYQYHAPRKRRRSKFESEWDSLLVHSVTKYKPNINSAGDSLGLRFDPHMFFSFAIVFIHWSLSIRLVQLSYSISIPAREVESSLPTSIDRRILPLNFDSSENLNAMINLFLICDVLHVSAPILSFD